MVETTDNDREGAKLRRLDAVMDTARVDSWFVNEVLPLEAMLMQYLHHNWRNKADVEDLLQDVYVRVYEAACKEIPHQPKSFVFTTARNLLINRARKARIVSIEAVADLEALGVALDAPGAERSVIARDELRRLQSAIEKLPPRCREVVVLRRIEGIPRREIAARMGISEDTVAEYLANGMSTLADMLYGEPADLRGRP
jgi:RNA polymerase sigma factor (sigma-70 family)